MMKYYVYRPDAEHFAGIGAKAFPDARDARTTSIHYSDETLLPSWSALLCHGFGDEDSDMQGDFPSFNNFWRIPIMSQRAWDVLRPLIGYCSEALPVFHPTGDPYYIIHVMETIDCLDVARSKFTRNDVSGRINCVDEYALKYEMLAGKHIFKLPHEKGGDLLIDDEFRNTVEANGLKGLLFKDLPVVG